MNRQPYGGPERPEPPMGPTSEAQGVYGPEGPAEPYAPEPPPGPYEPHGPLASPGPLGPHGPVGSEWHRSSGMPPDAGRPGTPVSPGAWNAHSWVLLDEGGLVDEGGPADRAGWDGRPGRADQAAWTGPRFRADAAGAAGDHFAPPGGSPPAAAGDVYWPEPGRADDQTVLDAAGVPAVEQTGVTAASGSPVASGSPETSGVAGTPASELSEGASVAAAPTLDATPASTPAADHERPTSGPYAAERPGDCEQSPDPVRRLLRQHRALCQHAVDPLEIAAGLEAHGVTDRIAAKYRHRDVFSLAEELYVRAPTPAERSSPTATVLAEEPDTPRQPVAVQLALGLLPVALCAAALVGLARLPETVGTPVRWAVGGCGVLAVLCSGWLALRSRQGGSGPRGSWPALCWLAGYALYGDWLLSQVLGGGPGPDAWPPAAGCACVPLTLAMAVAPAVGGLQLLAAHARRGLLSGHGLSWFTARSRPLLASVLAGYAALLVLLHSVAGLLVEGRLPSVGAQLATGTLGMLLFLALLLGRYGGSRSATRGLYAGCALQIAALGTVLGARLPGLGALGRPVERAVAEFGTTAVPVLAFGLPALVLLIRAVRTLPRASAHRRTP